MEDHEEFTIETRPSGALIEPYVPLTLEPITNENIHELPPGEWIWDDNLIERRIHKLSLGGETVIEPIGFRQINILDLNPYPRWNSKPFELSDVEGLGFDARSGWTYFEEGRFYRLERKD